MYEKQAWKDSDITKPVSAARMQHLDDGVSNSAQPGTDGTVGGPEGTPLSPSVVSSRLKEHGEVEGAITPSYTEASAHAYTLKGNVTVKPPSGGVAGITNVVELHLVQDSKGGHKISTEGIGLTGSAPVWNEEANAVNTMVLVSWNGGISWELVGPLRGEAGPVGPEAIGTGRLMRPQEVFLYREPGSSATETVEALAESLTRTRVNQSLLLTSGTPVCVAIEVPPKTKYKGLGFYIATTEGTAANRTHLWAALLNSKFEVLKRGSDYTSSTNTPLNSGSAPKALKFTEAGESGASPEILYGVLCEVMSSTNPITIGAATGTTALNEAKPRMSFLAEAGLTTPASLAATVVPSASLEKQPYLFLV